MCGIDWPSQHVECCPCGFAPEALDHFTVQMKLLRRRAAGKLVAGGLMVAAPVALLLLLPPQALGMLAAGLAAVVTFVIGGGILTARSLVAIFETTRRLRALDQLKQLPAARVVER